WLTFSSGDAMSHLTSPLADLRSSYLDLHTKKEVLFWQARMGLSDDAGQAASALANAEVELNRILQDPKRLEALAAAEKVPGGSEAERVELSGWLRMLRCHTLEDPSARALSEEIVQAEAALGRARGQMNLGYVDPSTGAFVEASTNKLALLVSN